MLVNLFITIILFLFSESASFNQNCDFFITADVAIVVYPPIPPPLDELTYHDGTPYWLSWEGKYRGTWFNVNEFEPTHLGCQIEGAELWFYHHVGYPWDTSDFYLELWEGNTIAPVNQLESNLVTASHYTPVLCSFSSSHWVNSGFWLFINTEMSNGGWPSILGDSGPNFTGSARSFVSSDFIIWEPWSSFEASTYLLSLEQDSWGQLKSLFK